MPLSSPSRISGKHVASHSWDSTRKNQAKKDRTSKVLIHIYNLQVVGRRNSKCSATRIIFSYRSSVLSWIPSCHSNDRNAVQKSVIRAVIVPFLQIEHVPGRDLQTSAAQWWMPNFSAHFEFCILCRDVPSFSRKYWWDPDCKELSRRQFFGQRRAAGRIFYWFLSVRQLRSIFVRGCHLLLVPRLMSEPPENLLTCFANALLRENEWMHKFTLTIPSLRDIGFVNSKACLWGVCMPCRIGLFFRCRCVRE